MLKMRAILKTYQFFFNAKWRGDYCFESLKLFFLILLGTLFISGIAFSGEKTPTVDTPREGIEAVTEDLITTPSEDNSNEEQLVPILPEEPPTVDTPREGIEAVTEDLITTPSEDNSNEEHYGVRIRLSFTIN